MHHHIRFLPAQFKVYLENNILHVPHCACIFTPSLTSSTLTFGDCIFRNIFPQNAYLCLSFCRHQVMRLLGQVQVIADFRNCEIIYQVQFSNTTFSIHEANYLRHRYLIRVLDLECSHRPMYDITNAHDGTKKDTASVSCVPLSWFSCKCLVYHV